MSSYFPTLKHIKVDKKIVLLFIVRYHHGNSNIPRCSFSHIRPLCQQKCQEEKRKEKETYSNASIISNIMSSDETLRTSFEYLPTETFLQIFAFFFLRELATAFSGLNAYMDSIIRSVRDSNHVKNLMMLMLLSVYNYFQLKLFVC